MAGKASDRYIAERVEALAIMHLTRRPDLNVRREIRPGSQVMDLMVEIAGQGRPLRKKTFGVYLQGTKTPVTIAHANAILGISLQRFFGDYGEPAIPFCLFYFTMEDNLRILHLGSRAGRRVGPIPAEIPRVEGRLQPARRRLTRPDRRGDRLLLRGLVQRGDPGVVARPSATARDVGSVRRRQEGQP
jgi:hypothetical protein